MLWTCTVAGCARGSVILDQQGIANHQADTGHAPVAGRAIGWVFDRSGIMPDIYAVSPATGPSTGATAITITGRGFTGATGVKIGTVAATAVVVVSDSTVTATTPAGTANSTQDVSVTTPHGTGVLSGGWKYGA
jgi:IPT/TIG domain-containing protein